MKNSPYPTALKMSEYEDFDDEDQDDEEQDHNLKHVCGHAVEYGSHEEEPCRDCNSWARGAHSTGAVEALESKMRLPIMGSRKEDYHAILFSSAIRALEVICLMHGEEPWNLLTKKTLKELRPKVLLWLRKEKRYKNLRLWTDNGATEEQGFLLCDVAATHKEAWLLIALNKYDPDRKDEFGEFEEFVEAMRKARAKHSFTVKETIELIASPTPWVRDMGREIRMEIAEREKATPKKKAKAR